jgi:5'-3' exonuclease
VLKLSGVSKHSDDSYHETHEWDTKSITGAVVNMEKLQSLSKLQWIQKKLAKIDI